MKELKQLLITAQTHKSIKNYDALAEALGVTQGRNEKPFDYWDRLEQVATERLEASKGKGGKREGAGRPTGIPTKVMRVPTALEGEILDMIDQYKKDLM